MGQYYKIVNLDKKQFLYSHAFGDGLKLLEFGSSGDGMMCGLAILLADGNGRGGGDLHSEDAIIGSWAGDRIVIAGDYADEGRWPGVPEDKTLYSQCASEEDGGDSAYKDISYQVIIAMADDGYLRDALKKRLCEGYRAGSTPQYVKDAITKPRDND